MGNKNQLFAADNLGVLRTLPPESVNLIYLDPPFNSKQDYNVIFKERSGSRSTSQQLVFKDSWKWSPQAQEVCRQLEEDGGRIGDVIRAFRTFLGDSDMMAYLAMMAPRLKEMRRLLKPSGSIYLHCDPSASHYLKILMDAIFGPGNFLNEIAWKRTTAHSSSKRYGPAHDILLYYSKSATHTWNPHYLPKSQQYEAKFAKVDQRTGMQFQDHDLTGPGTRAGESGKPWRGFNPTEKRRHWQIASYLVRKFQQVSGEDLNKLPVVDRLDRLDAAGLIYWPEKEGGFPRYKKFLSDAAGPQLLDVWADIQVINSQAQERLGYPTQKPLALLTRIIEASSDPGDTILDPFCGCGTAIEAAEKSHRRWIGIDITLLATAVIKTRLAKFGMNVFKRVEIIGEPVTPEEAASLADQDKFGFQWWAVGRLGAAPIERKKGRDRGVDGRIYFHDDTGAAKHIVISVKAGEHVGPAAVRELRGVVERDRANMGILVTAKQKTREMLREAGSAGIYKSLGGIFPKLQIITAADIFAAVPLNIPGRINPYEPKRPASVRVPQTPEQLKLLP